jgi:hypothetical protein
LSDGDADWSLHHVPKEEPQPSPLKF